LPDDEAFTASSGLRLGVQEMTRFGMKEDDFRQLAEYMAAAILDNEQLAQSVSSFRERFLEMQYCLPEEQARPLIDELIGSLIRK
jgi:glycine/serine hydroxymethyltransferase